MYVHPSSFNFPIFSFIILYLTYSWINVSSKKEINKISPTKIYEPYNCIGEKLNNNNWIPELLNTNQVEIVIELQISANSM